MRKLLIGLLGVGLVLASVLLALLLPRHCPVTRAACEQIKEGMTQAEVHAILGGPPGDYLTRPPGLRTFRDFTGPRLVETWQGDEGAATVRYSSAPGPETVVIATFEDAKPSSPGLVELLRWRLERLREHWLP